MYLVLRACWLNGIVFEKSLDVDGDTVEDILIIMDNDEYLK